MEFIYGSLHNLKNKLSRSSGNLCGSNKQKSGKLFKKQQQQQSKERDIIQANVYESGPDRKQGHKIYQPMTRFHQTNRFPPNKRSLSASALNSPKINSKTSSSHVYNECSSGAPLAKFAGHETADIIALGSSDNLLIDRSFRSYSPTDSDFIYQSTSRARLLPALGSFDDLNGRRYLDTDDDDLDGSNQLRTKSQQSFSRSTPMLCQMERMMGPENLYVSIGDLQVQEEDVQIVEHQMPPALLHITSEKSQQISRLEISKEICRFSQMIANEWERDPSTMHPKSFSSTFHEVVDRSSGLAKTQDEHENFDEFQTSRGTIIYSASDHSGTIGRLLRNDVTFTEKIRQPDPRKPNNILIARKNADEVCLHQITPPPPPTTSYQPADNNNSQITIIPVLPVDLCICDKNENIKNEKKRTKTSPWQSISMQNLANRKQQQQQQPPINSTAAAVTTPREKSLVTGFSSAASADNNNQTAIKQANNKQCEPEAINDTKKLTGNSHQWRSSWSSLMLADDDAADDDCIVVPAAPDSTSMRMMSCSGAVLLPGINSDRSASSKIEAKASVAPIAATSSSSSKTARATAHQHQLHHRPYQQQQKIPVLVTSGQENVVTNSVGKAPSSIITDSSPLLLRSSVRDTITTTGASSSSSSTLAVVAAAAAAAPYAANKNQNNNQQQQQHQQFHRSRANTVSSTSTVMPNSTTTSGSSLPCSSVTSSPYSSQRSATASSGGSRVQPMPNRQTAMQHPKTCTCHHLPVQKQQQQQQQQYVLPWPNPLPLPTRTKPANKRDSITSTESSSGASEASSGTTTGHSEVSSSSSGNTGSTSMLVLNESSPTAGPTEAAFHRQQKLLQHHRLVQQQQQQQQQQQYLHQQQRQFYPQRNDQLIGSSGSSFNSSRTSRQRSRMSSQNLSDDTANSPITGSIASDGGSTSSSASSSVTAARQQMLITSMKQFEDVPPKIRAARVNVIKEIVRSERNFAANLNGALQTYVRPCERRHDLFDKSWIQRVFAQLERVTEFSVAFLAKLEAALRLSSTCDGYAAPVPHVFLQMFGGNISTGGELFYLNNTNSSLGLDIYSDFCISEPLSELEFISLTNVSDVHREFFDECRLQKNLVPIPFQSYLIAPVQRICQYQLLLGELLKATPEDHPQRPETAAAATLMQRVATIINERRRQQESLERLALWQLAVDRWEGPHLLERSTRFIFSGALQEVKANGRAADRDCFVFDHQLIYCKRTALRMLVFKGRIDLDNSRIVPLMDGPSNGQNNNGSANGMSGSGGLIRNAWRVDVFAENVPEIIRSVTFKARTKEDKAEWMMALLKERKLLSVANVNSVCGEPVPAESRQLAWNYALKLFKEQTHQERGFGKRRVASASVDHQSSPFPAIFGSARQQASAEASRRISAPFQTTTGPINVAFTPDTLSASLAFAGSVAASKMNRVDKEPSSKSSPFSSNFSNGKRRSRSTIRAEDIVRVPGGGRLMINCVQTDV